MRKSMALAAVAFAAGTLVGTAPASAHHSYAMFDRTKQIKLDGVVKEFQWSNPHIFVELTVEGAGGETNYSIEGTSPGVLRRQGWKYDSIKAGDKVEVLMSPLKDGRPGGSLIYVLKDGVKLGNSTVVVDASKGQAQ